MKTKFVVCLAVLASSALGQWQVQPRFFNQTTEDSTSPLVGSKQAYISGVKIVMPYAGTGVIGVQGPVLTQIQAPGEVAITPGGGAILLCGAKDVGLPAASGILAVLADPSTGYAVVTPSYVETGSCFVGVAYAPLANKLYILDAAKKRIVSADYVVGDAPPTAYQVELTDITVPRLGNAWRYTIALDVDHLTSPRLVLAPYVRESQPANMVAGYIGEYYEITFGSPNPLVLQKATMPGTHLFSLANDRLVVGATSIDVRGEPGSVVAIVDYPGGATLGSNIIGPLKTASVSIAPAQMGTVYGTSLLPIGDRYGEFRTPMEFLGVNQPLDFGATFRGFDGGLGLDVHLDNQRFAIGMMVDQDPNQPLVGTAYEAALLIGLSTQTINGHVEVVGSAFTTDVVFSEPDFPGVLVVDMPIPNFDGLAGLTLCCQYVVDLDGTAGADLRFSEVAGVYIRALPFLPPHTEDLFPEEAAILADAASASAAASASGAASPGPIAVDVKRRLFRRWIRGRGGRPITSQGAAGLFN